MALNRRVKGEDLPMEDITSGSEVAASNLEMMIGKVVFMKLRFLESTKFK